MKSNGMMKTWLAGAVIATCLLGGEASAKMRSEGKWPESEKPVTVRLQGTRAEAVKKLAEAAGWSLLLETRTVEGDAIDLVVKDEEPRDVLEAILAKGDYVVTRKGRLVTIDRASASAPSPERPEAAAVPPVPPVPAVPPVPPVPPPPMTRDASDEANVAMEAKDGKDVDAGKMARGKDREAFGSSVRINANEVVHDLSVTGGNAEVYGTVTGDISVLGGNVTLHPSAVVKGDVAVRGGNLEIQRGARVEGDLDSAFGNIDRHPESIVLGDISERHGGDEMDIHDEVEQKLGHRKSSFWTRAVDHVRESLVNAALLFVLGVLMIALAPKKLDSLKTEIVAHPVRTMALGLVGVPLSIVVIVVLCVSLVGIPLALCGTVLLTLALLCSPAIALATAGELIDHRHRKNAFVQLATACVAFFFIHMIPVVGPIVTVLLLLAGFGSFVATRGLGLFDRIRKKRNSVPPSETATL